MSHYVEVGHSYTMADVHRIARTGLTVASSRASDGDERYQAAWDGIIDALCEAAEPPSERALAYAAADAVDAHNQTECRHHGRRGPWETGPNYVRYWREWTRPTPGPEPRVVDRVSVEQIWPRLTDLDRQAFNALANCGTYSRAAAKLGVPYFTFMTRINRARARFLALWHEGETPSRLWRADIRERRTDRWGSRNGSGTGGTNRAALLRAHGRDKTKAMPEHGTKARYDYHQCRCPPCSEAMQAYWRGLRARRRAAAGLPPVELAAAEHGTMRRYRQGCGCEACKAACRDRTRAYRTRKAMEAEAT